MNRCRYNRGSTVNVRNTGLPTELENHIVGSAEKVHLLQMAFRFFTERIMKLGHDQDNDGKTEIIMGFIRTALTIELIRSRVMTMMMMMMMMMMMAQTQAMCDKFLQVLLLLC